MERPTLFSERKGDWTVLNILAYTPLIYIASAINVPEIVINELKTITVDFMWDGGSSKIPYDVLIQDIGKGGLKLVDIEAKINSLKVAWVKRLTDTGTGKYKILASHFLGSDDLELFFKGNSHKISDMAPKFYHKILQAWSDINTIKNPTPEVILNQFLWKNKYFTIENKLFEWTTWKHHGILYVGDILDDNANFLSYLEMSEKYNFQCNFLNTLQIRQSIPLSWRKILTESRHN